MSTPTIQIQNSGAVPTIAGAPASPPLVTPGAQSPIPTMEFEKAQVTTVITKISGSPHLDAFGEPVSIDDRIRAVGEFKVIGVRHEVQKDGSIARIQIVSCISDLECVPWDPSDPNDKGIIHVRP